MEPVSDHQRKKRILHITPHLGGGAGKAITGVAEACTDEYDVTIAMLEKPEKENYLQEAISRGISVMVCPQGEVLKTAIASTDLVIVNWWAHPKMDQLLYDFPQVACRLILWSHINGCTYPFLPASFLLKADYIFFTSSFSYENPLWSEHEKQEIMKKSRIVYGNGQFEPETFPNRTSYAIQNPVPKVGYIGTVNYSKMSRDMVPYYEAFCEKYPMKEIEILLAGDTEQQVVTDVKQSRLREKFSLPGYCSQTRQLYLSFDVFVYLLEKENFGTTENALLEAMAYGIPVLAGNGGVEQAIIENEKNGLLVNNKEEFAEQLYRLLTDESLRHDLGQNGRRKVCSCFNSSANLKQARHGYQKVLENPKHRHEFKSELGDTPGEWFLHFTGMDYVEFMDFLQLKTEQLPGRSIYRGQRKSSIQHFLQYFPEDEILLKLKGGIQNDI